MLLSVTSDNRLPEAFAGNIIKSFLSINVTQRAPKIEKLPHVFLADASVQLRVHVSVSGLKNLTLISIYLILKSQQACRQTVSRTSHAIFSI